MSLVQAQAATAAKDVPQRHTESGLSTEKTVDNRLTIDVKLTNEEHNVLRVLQAAYPENRMRLARQTPIENLYEVIVGTSVAYVYVNVSALNDYLQKGSDKVSSQDFPDDAARARLFPNWIFGATLYDTKSLIDLTSPAKELAARVNVSTLPVNQAIVRVKGNPRHTLYVFTDPLCPYCIKEEAVFEQLTDIRIVTFLAPLADLHPEARELSARIWCAKDKVKAFEDVMVKGQKLEGKATCEAPILANEQLMKALSIKGTPTIILENGERITGAASLEKLREALKRLDEASKTPVTSTPLKR